MGEPNRSCEICRICEAVLGRCWVPNPDSFTPDRGDLGDVAVILRRRSRCQESRSALDQLYPGVAERPRVRPLLDPLDHVVDATVDELGAFKGDAASAC
jgi:hypothetical protein